MDIITHSLLLLEHIKDKQARLNSVMNKTNAPNMTPKPGCREVVVLISIKQDNELVFARSCRTLVELQNWTVATTFDLFKSEYA